MEVQVQLTMGLKDQLAGTIPAELLQELSDHFEVIGDVAVISLPPGLLPYSDEIARAIILRRHNILTVLNRAGSITGPDRTARYEVLYGKTTETVHTEFKFSYRLDVTESFFSARLAYERKRVTDQVEPGERVFIPFAGVGPFVIPAAARGAEVYAVEQNPRAFRYLIENISLNHVTGTCHAIQGDAFNTDLLPPVRFDRLIIPAPYGMDNALGRFLPLLSEGGMAHVYRFLPKEQVPAVLREYEEMGFDITFSSSCGNVAPGISRRVFDIAFPLLP